MTIKRNNIQYIPVRYLLTTFSVWRTAAAGLWGARGKNGGAKSWRTHSVLIFHLSEPFLFDIQSHVHTCQPFCHEPTKCPKIYRKSVLHLLGYTANLYLCIWSTDLRYILGHSVPILISVYIGYVYPDYVYFYTVFLYIWLISTCQNPFHWT